MITSDDEEEILLVREGIPVVWKTLISVCEKGEECLKGKWFACIYHPLPRNSKHKAPSPSLIFGTLISIYVKSGRHFVQIDCCKPYDLDQRGDTVEEYETKGEDIWDFDITDVFAGPFIATYQNKREWFIPNANSMVEAFDELKNKNRQNLLSLVAVEERDPTY